MELPAAWPFDQLSLKERQQREEGPANGASLSNARDSVTPPVTIIASGASSSSSSSSSSEGPATPPTDDGEDDNRDGDLNLTDFEVPDDLAFLEQSNLCLIPPPPPSDDADDGTAKAVPRVDTSCVRVARPEVCPHCTGERSGIGRYRERERPRKENPLGYWNAKHGYDGPAYCKACSESFRSHLLRQKRNPRNGCSRAHPCRDCERILAHFGGRSPAEIFSAYDNDQKQVGGMWPESAASAAAPARAAAALENADTPLLQQRHPKRQRKATVALASSVGLGLLCVVAVACSTWQHQLAEEEEPGQRQRQLSTAAGGASELIDGTAADRSGAGSPAVVGPQTCCPTCCTRLPAVPAWVPIRFVFPFMATDWSALPPTAAAARVYYLDERMNHDSGGGHGDGDGAAGNTTMTVSAIFRERRRRYYGAVWGYMEQGQCGLLCRIISRAWGASWGPVPATIAVAYHKLSKLAPLLSASFNARDDTEAHPYDAAAASSSEETLEWKGPFVRGLGDGGEWKEEKATSNDEGVAHGSLSRLWPTAPHIRTAALLSTPATALLIAKGSPAFRTWKAVAALIWGMRPLLTLGLAWLADFADPGLEFGIRHEL
jgi:hypothetical protein